MNRILLLLYGLAIALLPACGDPDSPINMLRAYLAQVEEITGVESRAVPATPLSVYPSHRDRTLPVQDVRVGLLGFFDYDECGLMHLVSERNTILGKVMPISQRLVYEIEFLRRAEACYVQIGQAAQPDQEFIAHLGETIRIKRNNLAKIFWNATFDSPEMQKAFSLAVDPLNPDEATAYTASQQAVEYFHRIGVRLSDPLLEIDKSELEQQYYVLQADQYGGRLLTAIARLTDYLTRVADSLETALAARSLCDPQRSEHRKLRDLHERYYLVAIRPYLSQVHQQGREWLEAIEGLIEVQKVESPLAFAEYRRSMLSLDAENGLWRRFERAGQRHAEVWRRVIGWCSRM